MTHRSSSRQANGFGNGASSFYESHNDSLVDELSKKVSTLKKVTIAIGDDVREQNRLLDQMDTDFDSSRGLLGATMHRLGIVSRAGASPPPPQESLIKGNHCTFVHDKSTEYTHCGHIMSKKELFQVIIPHSNDFLHFNTFEETKSFLNSPQGKSLGTRFKKVKESDIDLSNLSPAVDLPTTSAINEPILPYKPLKPQRLNELKRAIEQKNNAKFDELLTENPYFIINMSGDTPSIIHSGCWYNSMHVACRCGNLYVVCKILECVTDLKWLENSYGTDASVEDRAKFLLDAFLNTPDKSENNTPLHYACKYGYADIVEVLLSHLVCFQDPKNKYSETPLEIACQAYKGENKCKILDEIRQKFGQKLYVTLYRGTDNCVPARLVICDQLFFRIPEESFKMSTESPKKHSTVKNTPIRRLIVENLNNKSLSPSTLSQDSGPSTPRHLNEFHISAIAGPFKDFAACEQFYQEWSLGAVGIRLRDPDKGFEVVGRLMATKYSVNFVEYFVFLGELINLNTIKGLQVLENYLQSLYEKKAYPKRQFGLSHENLVNELKLPRFEKLNLSTNTKDNDDDDEERDDFQDSRESFDEAFEDEESDSSDVYITPPQTPPKSPVSPSIMSHSIYVFKDVPTREDDYLASILEKIDHNFIGRFPCISNYLHQIREIPKENRADWIKIESPRIKDYINSIKRPFIRQRLILD